MLISKVVAHIMKLDMNLPKGVGVGELKSIVNTILLSQVLTKHGVDVLTQVNGFNLNLTYSSASLKVSAHHSNPTLNFNFEFPIKTIHNVLSTMEEQFNNLIETVTITKCNYPVNLSVIKRLIITLLSHELQHTYSNILNEKGVDYWIDLNLPHHALNTLILNEVCLRNSNNNSDEVIFSVHNKLNREIAPLLFCGSFNLTLFNELRLANYN